MDSERNKEAMTILEKKNRTDVGGQEINGNGRMTGGNSDATTRVQDVSSELSEVESQFKKMMSEFKAIGGFSVDTGESAVDTMIELLSSREVAVSITVLLSYIRYCVNHGIKKDITLKIGHNKPPSIPMNFAINEELLEEIYPGDVVEIN